MNATRKPTDSNNQSTRRYVVLAAIAGLIIGSLGTSLIASCSSDDDDGSDTTTAATETPSTDSEPAEGEPADVNENIMAEVPSDDKPIVHDHLTCTYRPHEVIAASDEETKAIVETIVHGVEEVTPLSGEGGIDLGLSLYQYAPSTDDELDPLVVAQSVFEQTKKPAAPNYLYAFAPFWTYAPGDTPVPVSAPTEVIPLSDEEVSIAVLDTGYLFQDPPNQNVTVIRPTTPGAASGLATSPDDVMNGVAAGHGTFIVDMLERLLPNAQITAVAVDPRLGFDDEFPSPAIAGGSDRAVNIRDDATLARAFTEVLGTDPSEFPDYVNLSLGSYGCSGVSPGDLENEPYYVPIGLGTAFQKLDELHATGETDVQVFAAAGNDGHDASNPEVFYPAAWAVTRPWLTSVGSNPLPDGTVYSNQGSWVEVQALGSKVVSRRPPPASDSSQIWYEWSGTSFATPCALASDAAGTPISGYGAGGGTYIDCGINS